MRNKVQVHHNGGTKPASVQTKTARRTPAEKPGDEMTTLAICARFKRRGKVYLDCLHPDIGITTDEWTKACRENLRWKELGIGTFFAAAIREKLARNEKWETEQALESASRKAIGLLDLLYSKLVADADDCLNPSLPAYDEKKTQIVCGIQELLMEVKAGLTAGLCGDSKKGTEVVS